jgi:hypothetical protein
MIAIPEHLEQAAAYIAGIENTPVDEWVTKQIEKSIEDYLDLQAADAAMQDPKTLSMSEAMSLLDDLDN